MRARRSTFCVRCARAVASWPFSRASDAADQGDSGADQHQADEHRERELLQFGLREVHGSLRSTTTVKRGASPESVLPPMSPVSVPSEVTSKGSWVRTSS